MEVSLKRRVGATLWDVIGVFLCFHQELLSQLGMNRSHFVSVLVQCLWSHELQQPFSKRLVRPQGRRSLYILPKKILKKKVYINAQFSHTKKRLSKSVH